jgi:uncharacterized phage-associated protein
MKNITQAIDVAEFILDWHQKKSSDETICLLPSYFQTLLYYCQGYYLALNNTPLFDDKIILEDNTPIIETIKDIYCPLLYPPYAKMPKSDKRGDINKLSKEQISLIDEILYVIGQFSMWKMKEMNSKETPITTAQINIANEPTNNEITQQSMKEYFINYVVKD